MAQARTSRPCGRSASFWQNVKDGRYSITEVKTDRWDPALYYDADHGAPDKTYSKIGGWVREHVWDPVKWRLAGQQNERHTRQRVLVCARVDVLAPDLLGRRIIQRSHEMTCCGQAGRRPRSLRKPEI